MREQVFEQPALDGFAPISLEAYLSEYEIEMEGSLMITGITSRFHFMNANGGKIELPRTSDKALVFSFLIDRGDEWQDIQDRLAYFELIDPKNGKILKKEVRSPLWREQSGLTPTRYERLSKLVEDGVRPTGAIRRNKLASHSYLNLALTLNGADGHENDNFSNLFFAGFDPSRYLKLTINNIYFSMVADSEAPTLAAFERESAPVFLFSDPKLSLHNR